MKSTLGQRVSDFLMVENGRVDAGASMVVGGFAVTTLLLGVLAGKAEARACCTATCTGHMDQYSNGYADSGEPECIYQAPNHTNCYYDNHHINTHYDCV